MTESRSVVTWGGVGDLLQKEHEGTLWLWFKRCIYLKNACILLHVNCKIDTKRKNKFKFDVYLRTKKLQKEQQGVKK